MEPIEIAVIYHAGCTDGFCAAWLFHKVFPCAEFVPAQYGDTPLDLFKLRLADRTWYLPDFLVIKADGSIEFHEVKGGFIREDGWLKVAVEQYPHFKWVLAQLKNKEWTIKTL